MKILVLLNLFIFKARINSSFFTCAISARTILALYTVPNTEITMSTTAIPLPSNTLKNIAPSITGNANTILNMWYKTSSKIPPKYARDEPSNAPAIKGIICDIRAKRKVFLNPITVLMNISLPILSVPKICGMPGAANLEKFLFPRLNFSEINEIISTAAIMHRHAAPQINIFFDDLDSGMSAPSKKFTLIPCIN